MIRVDDYGNLHKKGALMTLPSLGSIFNEMEVRSGWIKDHRIAPAPEVVPLPAGPKQ